jgi:hypothetical protein
LIDFALILRATDLCAADLARARFCPHGAGVYGQD